MPSGHLPIELPRRIITIKVMSRWSANLSATNLVFDFTSYDPVNTINVMSSMSVDLLTRFVGRQAYR